MERVLNLLCHRAILEGEEYRYLNARNLKSLECKQKRYRNLEVREHRAMMSMGANVDGDEGKGHIRQSSSFY